jgi:hypothetical protein
MKRPLFARPGTPAAPSEPVRAPAVLRPQGLAPSRRKALERLALGMGAFGMTGCFETAKAQLPTESGGNGNEAVDLDVNLLGTLVIMENVAWRTYEAAATLLSAGLVPVAEAFGGHHAEHRDDAIARLADLGESPPELVEALENLPDFGEGAERDVAILRYALATERQAVSAYLGLIGQMTGWGLRSRAADILTCEVSHYLALRQALGPAEDVGAPLAVANYAFFTELPPPAAT